MKPFLFTVVALYVALVVATYFLQRRMMYYPDNGRPRPADYGVPEMNVASVTTDDGLALTSWYAPPTRPGAPVVVYLHGNAGHIGDRGPVMRPYLAAGLGALLVGYRGYGGNPGAPTEDGLYTDARAALDWLWSNGGSPEKTVLYGESLGSGVAVHLAQENGTNGSSLGAVVLQAPFTSTADVGAQYYWYLPVRLLMRDRYESITKIAGIAAPLLILYSESDQVVPPRLSKELFAAAAEPKFLREYRDAGHNSFEHTGAPGDILDFIARHID